MEPNLTLSKKSLPPALLKAIEFVFSKGIKGVVLVGGTGIAGFYAGHRKSNDMDLFTQSDASQTATVMVCRSLEDIGAKVKIIENIESFFNATCELDHYNFTIQVVKDPHLFQVARILELKNGIKIADFETLFKMKAATLVSRCGEKDLFDLKWFFGQKKEISVADLVQMAQEIDGGANAESMYMSVAGTKLRENACNFSLDPKADERSTYLELVKFQKDLIKVLQKNIEGKPLPPIGKLFKSLKS
jgi:hypothetical protein